MSVLESVLTNEMPAGGLVFVELFVDINILPCHNPNLDPGNASSMLTWEKSYQGYEFEGIRSRGTQDREFFSRDSLFVVHGWEGGYCGSKDCGVQIESGVDWRGWT